MDSASLLVLIKNKIFIVLVLGFSVGDVIIGAYFLLFGQVYLTPTQRVIFLADSKFSLETRL